MQNFNKIPWSVLYLEPLQIKFAKIIAKSFLQEYILKKSFTKITSNQKNCITLSKKLKILKNAKNYSPQNIVS